MHLHLFKISRLSILHIPLIFDELVNFFFHVFFYNLPLLQKSDDAAEEIADSVNAAHFSQGLVAAGLTSTVMEPVTLNKAAVLDEDTVKYV